MYTIINMAVCARDFAARAKEHSEINEADYGFIDTAYWLCHDMRDAIEQAQDALEPELDTAFSKHALAATWYEIMQATCDDLVTFAGERDHEIRRS